jgi:hypothetical protein
MDDKLLMEDHPFGKMLRQDVHNHLTTMMITFDQSQRSFPREKLIDQPNVSLLVM